MMGASLPFPGSGRLQAASSSPIIRPSRPLSRRRHVTAEISFLQGDVNCDGALDENDFRFLIGYAAALNDGTNADPCSNLNTQFPAATIAHPWGDVNCDDAVNALDALYVLAKTVGIALQQPQGVRRSTWPCHRD